MADNYLEKQYEDFLKSKARKEAEKRYRWQKQMNEYKKRMAEKSANAPKSCDDPK